MLVPLIMVMWQPILKHLLISIFPFVLFCESQISIYTIAMSDLRNALMTQGHEAKTTLLKI